MERKETKRKENELTAELTIRMSSNKPEVVGSNPTPATKPNCRFRKTGLKS